MLDQRGTGLSTPLDRNTLPLRGSALEQFGSAVPATANG
jgi:proline iminopeptidase